MPPNSDLIELLESKGIELESKLNVNYEMCLNSLKQDSEEFGTLLKHSFFANETATVKIQARQKKKRADPIIERSNDLQCVYGAQDQIKVLYDMIDKLWDANEEIAGKTIPMPLSIVQVVTEKHLFKDGIVLRPCKSLVIFSTMLTNFLLTANNKFKSIVMIFWPVGDSMPI